MSDYYKKVKGHLANGEIAYAEDINLIQTNVADAFKAAISDHHEHDSFILGNKENAFKLTPAPKRLGRYIDTMSLVESGNEKWLSIRKWSYRQIIKKSKTSLYSLICKFRNLSNNPVTVWCRLEGRDGHKYTETRTSITIPANTEAAEFEIVFDVKYIATALGLSHKDVEAFDSKYVAPPPNEMAIEPGIDHTNEQDLKNFTIGASEVYFIIEALNINETDIAINGDEDNIITDETFAVLADKNGSYGQLLEQGQNDFNKTGYDLYFKDIYATTSTYLCETGEAIINGEKIKCLDTHISIAGANDYGNVDTYVYMDHNGHLKAINSSAYLDKRKNIVDLPGAILPIAIITTYMDDVKQPVVYQDDTSLVVRPRSHHERIRRLEKKVAYLDDIAVPSRLKCTLSGNDIINENPDGEVGQIDKGNFYLTTNAKGDTVIKTTKAEVINIPVTLKENSTPKISNNGTEIQSEIKLTKALNDISAVTQLAEIKNLEHDQEKGSLKLKTIKDASEDTASNKKEESSDFNPWNEHVPSEGFEPIEREYVTNKTEVRHGIPNFSQESEYPAMIFTVEKDYLLDDITVPITKFKNCEGIRFTCCKLKGSDNETNNIWIEKCMFVTQDFPLTGVKERDGFQIVENGITIPLGNFSKKHTRAFTLTPGKYVLIAVPIPKEGQGSCFVNTYKVADPKNFCVRFYGVGQFTDFAFKEKYMEVWYNACTFKGVESKLATEGSVTSGTVVWENEEPITGIMARANINTPENCSYELYADTGGGFQRLELGKTTSMTGGGMSFKWKLVLKGKNDTPILSYSDKKKYAISFTLTRKEPDIGTYDDTNNCLTTKTFKAEDILKAYIGDDSFNPTNKFSNYEFVRVWGDEVKGMNNFASQLIIDVAGSNETASITYPVTSQGTTTQKTVNTDIFSFIYADLTLDDFNTTSVDYSNYDPNVEYDEHNLRLKLDTEHSYNDNNIGIYAQYDTDVEKDFIPTNGVSLYYIGSQQDYIQGLSFRKGTSPTENKTIFKISPPSPIDLTKYTGLQLRFCLYGTPTNEEVLTALKGIGLYISSSKEDDTPSFIDKEDTEIISGVDILPDLNEEKQDIIDQYYGKIIKHEQTINGITYVGYFKYIKSDGKYTLQQVHNLKSYTLYQLPNFSFSKSRSTVTSADGTSADYSNVYVTVDIDSNNINLSDVKEIGLVTLVNENQYQVAQDCALNLEAIKGVKDDYIPIYNPTTDEAFKPFRNDLAGTSNHYTSTLQTQKTSNANPQKRCRIDMYYNRIAGDGEIIAYYPIEKSFSNYKHMSVQLAANCWVPKNALELHLCSDSAGKESVFSLRIPTLNMIHNPATSTVTTNKDDGFVKFSQIFKKINQDINIKSISIRATTRFKEYMKEIRGSDNAGYVSLYIGKIVLYKAETIPMLYKNIRLKIYDNNRFEGWVGRNVNLATIRKVGCVIEYK